MLGAASALLEPIEGYYQDYAREYYPQAEQELRTQLDEQDFTKAWQAGRQAPVSILKAVEEWKEYSETVNTNE
jgi:hypothetical protein